MTDITAARAKIVALREMHRGRPAVRHHCNLVLKQIDNFNVVQSADRPTLANLIRQTMTELSNLLPGEK